MNKEAKIEKTEIFNTQTFPSSPIIKPQKVRIVSFAGYMKRIPNKLKNLQSNSTNTIRPVTSTFASPAAGQKYIAAHRKIVRKTISVTLLNPAIQTIHIFKPRTSKETTELTELRSLQKVMNKDFSFSEKNTKVQPKNEESEKHRLQNSPGIFILAVISGRIDQISNYLISFCGGAVERRILINSNDEYGRSPFFYAVFKGIFTKNTKKRKS